MTASARAKSAAPAADYVVKDIGLADWGRQGNRHRRNRDAGPDGDAGGVWGDAATQGRARRRLAAHDHPDRGADRDAARTRRRRALGLLQHLFDPGPRRRRGRRRRHAGVRGQRRIARRLLGIHPQDLRVGRRRHAQHDPGRRRRCHAADPSRRARGSGRHQVPRWRDQRGRGGAVRLDQEAPQGEAGLVRTEWQEHPRRHRGDHHRRAPALRHAEEGHAALARHQRQRLASPSRSSTISMAVASRWSTASAAAPT